MSMRHQSSTKLDELNLVRELDPFKLNINPNSNQLKSYPHLIKHVYKEWLTEKSNEKQDNVGR